MAFAERLPPARRHPPMSREDLAATIAAGQRKGRTLWEIARKENYRGVKLSDVHAVVNEWLEGR
jgi:hypothetical protein